jgi:hypothetical protein
MKSPNRPFNYYRLPLISATNLLLQAILALANEGMVTDDGGSLHVPETVLAVRVSDRSVGPLSRSTEHALKFKSADVTP